MRFTCISVVNKTWSSIYLDFSPYIWATWRTDLTGAPERQAALLSRLVQPQVGEQISQYLYFMRCIFQPGHSTKYHHYLTPTNTSKPSKILLVEIHSKVYATNPT